jgi:hypothetical protein
MSRSTLRTIGLVLLIPSVFLGILPFLAQHSDLSQGWSDFQWMIGNFRLAKFDTSAGPGAMFVSHGVWLVAALGELFLIGAHFVPQSRKNRYTLSLN